MKRILLHLTMTIVMVAFILTPFGSPVIAWQDNKTTFDSHFAIPTATTIQGTVRDTNGNLVNGIIVRAGDYDTMVNNCGSATASDTTDASGNYTLIVTAGSYLVFVNSHNRPEGYLPEAYAGIYSWANKDSTTAVTLITGQEVTGIDFILPFGNKISGRLVDGTAQPVLGAGGTLEDIDQKIKYTCALGEGSSNTDGTFQFNVPIGLYNLNLCKNSECHLVLKGSIINADISLGDVLFANADNPPNDFFPQTVVPGYNIETVVPGGQNSPSDVTITPDGHIYLAAVRSRHVYEVSGGSLSDEEDVMVYGLQAGVDGYLYGYFHPSDPGAIYKITPGGSRTTVGTVTQTSCESPLAVAPTPNPNPDLWVGWNGCAGTGMGSHLLYRVPQNEVAVIVANIPGQIYGLDFDSNGNLFMTSLDEYYHFKLYQVNTTSGALTELAQIPEPTSFHGLVAGQGGNKYIGTSWNDATHDFDTVYKVNSSNILSPLTYLPAGCLNGMTQEPISGDLFGTMRCTGALYRIHLDGSWETVLPGNGMSSPDVMDFNPAGELLVNNNESGAIIKILGDRGQYFTSVWSFTPPYADFAFLPSGKFYYSEAAPGRTPYLSLISPDGELNHVTESLDFPSGLTFDPTGQLFAVEYMPGTVMKVSSSGAITPWVSGLTRPQPLAADSLGNLYVGDYSGSPQEPPNEAEVVDTDRLWQVDPSGIKTFLLDHEFRMIAISPYDQLFISGKVGDYYYGVLRVNSDQSLTPIAIGFLDPVGLAFDVVGDLYVADLTNNSIHRITGFPHGTLDGHITNSISHEPIPQARLSLATDYPLIKGVRIETDINGYYNILAEPRQYTLTVSAFGFCQATITVTMAANQTTTLDLPMQPCPLIYLPLVLKP